MGGLSCPWLKFWEDSFCPFWGGLRDEGMLWYVLGWYVLVLYVDMMKGALLTKARLESYTELVRSWLGGYLAKGGRGYP